MIFNFSVRYYLTLQQTLAANHFPHISGHNCEIVASWNFMCIIKKLLVSQHFGAATSSKYALSVQMTFVCSAFLYPSIHRLGRQSEILWSQRRVSQKHHIFTSILIFIYNCLCWHRFVLITVQSAIHIYFCFLVVFKDFQRVFGYLLLLRVDRAIFI